MRLGLVGSEAKKFTPETNLKAREVLRGLITYPEVEEVVSGACHLGGIDLWAIEEARKVNVPTREFPPLIKKWEGGYRQRNMQIAEASDWVVCLTVKELPKDFHGMRFSFCYHCGTSEHVKSGGCWTVKYAKSIGKKGSVIVIE